MLLLLGQSPAIGLMVALTFGSIRSSFAEQHAADTKQVIFVLVVATLWCAGTRLGFPRALAGLRRLRTTTLKSATIDSRPRERQNEAEARPRLGP